MTEPSNSIPPVVPVTPVPFAPVSAVPLVKPKKKGSGRATNLILVLAALVAVGGVAFAGGRATASSSGANTGTTANRAFPGGNANGFVPGSSFTPVQGGTRAGGLTITGTVTAVDGSKLTIAETNGSTVTVDTASATYHKRAAATSSDVTTGTSVQVSVSGGGFPGGGGPGSSNAPAASGAPVASATTLTASEVTITTK